ncbi:hypothetical protein POUND7_018018 [Theobroma cacao]
MILRFCLTQRYVLYKSIEMVCLTHRNKRLHLSWIVLKHHDPPPNLCPFLL